MSGDLKMVEMSSSFGPGFVPKTIGDFLDELSGIAGAPEKMSKLDDLVIRLEVEMKKIDAFKRELPLCALLLNDAISALKESLRNESVKAEPVFVEYIPVRTREFDDGDRDKKNWLKSVQLWHSDDGLEHDTKAEKKRSENDSRFAGVIEWSDRFPGKDRMEKSSSSVVSITSEYEETSSWHVKLNRQLVHKPRRCWSADLHERFVTALQNLGGAEAATPKQIRDLMQVKDLTNDEVKSHLQKYRLHARRTNQAVSRSHSGSPQGRLQLGLAAAKTGNGAGGSFEDAKCGGFGWKTCFQNNWEYKQRAN